MDFAREHLKQLGWEEGGGLGREQHGITEPLKPKLKFDYAGIGHDPAKEFTHTWWSEAYNSAASNMTVAEATDGCQLVAKPKKKKKKKDKTTQSTYKNFVTGGLLVGDQMTSDGGSNGDTVEKEAAEDPTASRLSDDQLLAACGGRTAHKGARHGHKMDGKLARIMAQEAAILARLENGKGAAETVAKKKKKKRARVEVEEVHSVVVECVGVTAETDGLKVQKKKNKKRVNTDAVDAAMNDQNDADDSLPEKKKKKKRKMAQAC